MRKLVGGFGEASGTNRKRRGSLSVYESLREDILWLRMMPGAALDEMALAERFGISRTPIREALLMLASEDLVQLLPNRTSVVAPHSMDNLGEYLDVHLVLSRSVARSAALRRTSSDLEAIRALERAFQIQTSEDGTEDLLRADLSLRQRISDAARNSFLDKFYRLILDYGIRAKVLHYIPNASASELLDAAELASALVDAIEARDEEECDRVVITMLGRERRILSRCLEPRFGDEIRLPPPFAEKCAAA